MRVFQLSTPGADERSRCGWPTRQPCSCTTRHLPRSARSCSWCASPRPISSATADRRPRWDRPALAPFGSQRRATAAASRLARSIRAVACRVLGYLDYAATTPMRPEAVDAMLPFLSERFANPSGAHLLARDARRALDEARDVLAEALGAQPGEIVFTSGGTESDNLAVLGVARSAGRNRRLFGHRAPRGTRRGRVPRRTARAGRSARRRRSRRLLPPRWTPTRRWCR